MNDIEEKVKRIYQIVNELKTLIPLESNLAFANEIESYNQNSNQEEELDEL